jgi:ABC-type multidrug transport system fused ATPase/permease subunit
MTKPKDYDLDGNGKLDQEERELYLEDMKRQMEDADAQRDSQRRMAWAALIVMFVSTAAVIIWPAAMNEASAILMMMYGSLSALVGAFFGFTSKGKD